MHSDEGSADPIGNGDTLTLRRATIDDARRIFEWRNMPEMIPLSRTQKPVAWQEHWRWFQRIIAGREHLLLIVLLGEEPIGEIRFDRLTERTWEISILLVPKHTGRRLGVQALTLACQEIFALGAEQIIAIIRKENQRSVIAFQKAGFRPSDKPLTQIPPNHIALVAKHTE
jgi:RimJ/RimL family protein N-acetyltransferase